MGLFKAWEEKKLSPMSQDEDYTLYSTWNGSGAYPAGMLVNTNIIWNELMCFKQIHT